MSLCGVSAKVVHGGRRKKKKVIAHVSYFLFYFVIQTWQCGRVVVFSVFNKSAYCLFRNGTLVICAGCRWETSERKNSLNYSSLTYYSFKVKHIIFWGFFFLGSFQSQKKVIISSFGLYKSAKVC